MGQEPDLFGQINNALFDLQGSQLQTFQRPLRALAQLLHHPDLEAFNGPLTERVDLEDFLVKSAQTGGSMMGSQQLIWPENDDEVLGIQLKLIDKLAADPDYATDFAHNFFYSGNKIIAGIHSLTRQMLIPFARDYKAYVMSRGNVRPRLVTSVSNKVFIVHGHDEGARETVARFLEKIGFDPIILHEQANQGRTIIEKVEAHGDVGFAVVLLTGDDEGRIRGTTELRPRARQNVLLELGYFIGRLGRDRVCALKRGDVELPSDFAGVVWETMDAVTGWKQALGRELDAAGYSIDWNKVMGR